MTVAGSVFDPALRRAEKIDFGPVVRSMLSTSSGEPGAGWRNNFRREAAPSGMMTRSSISDGCGGSPNFLQPDSFGIDIARHDETLSDRHPVKYLPGCSISSPAHSPARPEGTRARSSKVVGAPTRSRFLERGWSGVEAGTRDRGIISRLFLGWRNAGKSRRRMAACQ